VFSVILHWYNAGKPRATDTRHDFRESIESLNWIVRYVFGLSPLLDGHREEQERISNPHLTWIRAVAVARQKAHRLDRWLKPGEIVDICDAQVVDFGASQETNDDQRNLAMGRNLGRALGGRDRIQVGGFLIEFEEKRRIRSSSTSFTDEACLSFHPLRKMNTISPGLRLMRLGEYPFLKKCLFHEFVGP
jgi:hypothetical protein